MAGREFRWSPSTFPGFLDRYLQGATLTSDFEREKQETGANDVPLTDAIRHTWDPIAALTMTWGNGMTTDFRATTSDVTASNIRGGLIDSRRDDDATDLTATLTYTIMPGTKVYIPFPTLWGVELKQPLRR